MNESFQYIHLDPGCSEITPEDDKQSDNSSKSSEEGGIQEFEVEFLGVLDVYLTDCDIRCMYEVKSKGVPQIGDRIALYKVGWESISDLEGFVWVQIPDISSQDNKSDLNNVYRVLFPDESLPKDECSSYQLCYVRQNSYVAGVSKSFSFRKPTENELEAIQDPTDGSLVIYKSKLSQWQDQFFSVSMEKDILARKVSYLESRNQDLLNPSIDSLKSFEEYKEEIKELTDLLNKSKENLEIKNKEMDETKKIHTQDMESLKSSILEMEKLKEEAEQTTQMKTDEVESMKEKLKSSQEENDQLKSKLLSLEAKFLETNEARDEKIQKCQQEKDKFEAKFEELQERHRELLQEVETLNEKLRCCQQEKDELQAQQQSQEQHAQEEVEVVNEKLRCCQQEKDELQAKYQSLEQHAQETDNDRDERFRNCQEEKDKFQTKFEKLQERHREFLQNMEIINEQLVECQEKNHILNATCQSLEHLQEDMEVVNQNLRCCQEEKNELQAKYHSLEEHAQEVKKELRYCQLEKDKLQETCQLMEQHFQREMKTLNEIIQRCEAENHKLQEDNLALEHQINDGTMEALKGKFQKYAENWDDFQAKFLTLGHLNEEMEHMNQQFKNCQQERDELRAKCDSLEELLLENAAKLKEAQVDSIKLKILQQAKASGTSRADGSTEMKSDTDKDGNDVAKANKVLREDPIRLREQLDALKAELKSKELALKLRRSDNKEISKGNDLVVARHRIRELEMALASKKNELEMANSRKQEPLIKEATTEMNKNSSDLNTNEVHEDLKEARHRIHELEALLEGKDEKIAAARSRIGVLEVELSAGRQDNSELVGNLRRNVEKLMSSESKMYAEVLSLREKVRVCQQSLDKASKEIVDLRMEAVGKVSLDSVSHLHEEINRLKNLLQSQD